MKRQTAADLQQDYLDAMELAAQYMAADLLARGAELFSKFAVDLSQQSELEFAELRVIALLNLCRMQERLQQTGESERTRQEAISMLDQMGESGNRLNIQDRLADVLVEFGEYRRAIRPCEQAIKLSRGSSVKLANRLWRAGRTYLRAGFKQHAEEPLRKSVEFFRATKSDPRTPVILNDLGNALRTSNPPDAEISYREAAAIWENKNAFGQAATAWVNLGILCGEQGRLDESLEWYEKVRRVRQADATTPRARLGSLANNVANLHRRMKNFDLAAREVEDAIALLEGDPLLAEAYGTCGLILRDQGLDEASLDWFRRSRVEHARQPSPNIGQLSEVLANEAAALVRLGRPQEASALEQDLSKLRGDLPPLHKHEVTPVAKAVEHAGDSAGVVLIELDGVHLPESIYRDCDIATLENRLEDILEISEQGELDGHETGPENTTLFLYGADAEALFRAVEPVLRDYPLCRGARVTIRQDDRERRVVLAG
jgi:tetratricopeptide (TPR) repeat protein